MRRSIVYGILVLGSLLATTVYAHFAESYTYFIEGVEDESATTARLEKEIADTNREIEQINPQLATLEQEYGSEKDAAVSKLQFYNTIGLDALTGYILQSESITDVLANRRIVEKQLKDDLSRLNDLYQHYAQTKAAKETLAGHEKLLDIIRRNLEERETFDAVAKNLSPKDKADLAAQLWTGKVEGQLTKQLQEDANLLKKNEQQFITRASDALPYRFEEERWNEKSKLSYLYRSDHVYVYYENNNASVILLGTVGNVNDAKASLKFEAGFLNGIALSDELVDFLHGFEIDYAGINPKSKGFYVEQANGAIIIQPMEVTAD
ncbi:MAG: hypothetical protein K0R75_3283 [Paenibacillaceae bacterium]|jgi:hypothetical protein|nr:hypothetical protein [Paenibacillaceae bacterium]